MFFDIEGYPLEEGGLEYLWGNAYFDENKNRCFMDFWAHNHEQEKEAFKAFIDWVYARWQDDPHMHIYHYANYEIAACRKLIGRYGVCEHEVDQLLRNNVFVDLYKIVRSALLLGEPRYSIKNVEHLYRPARDTAVGDGGDSIVVYEQWRTKFELGEETDDWNTSPILKDIRDYNIDDCDSTQELVDWLRARQSEHNIHYVGQEDVIEPPTSETITERTELRNRLLSKAKQIESTDPKEALLTRTMAGLLEFHRREEKPAYWRMFDRIGLSHIELMDDLDCLGACTRTSTAPFKMSTRKRKQVFEYQFDPTQEFKAAANSYMIIGTDDEFAPKVAFVAEHSDLKSGLIAIEAMNEPPSVISLIPDEIVSSGVIQSAIQDTVEKFEKAPNTLCALNDFLRRKKPRFKTREKGSIVDGHDPKTRLQQLISAVKELDNCYLTIQGPPGAGKTYSAKHTIAELVKSGARIAISSNSHKAINNLLVSTAEYCQEQGINTFFVTRKNTDPAIETLDIAVFESPDFASVNERSCVMGSTAWTFARDDLIDAYDYLFIDEAGQMSLANLVAISRCAKNIVLMGDQMQLGQPIQGSHPAESGVSVLDYLLHDRATIPEDMGIFLKTTYRMHSKVCGYISDQFYELVS